MPGTRPGGLKWLEPQTLSERMLKVLETCYKLQLIITLQSTVSGLRSLYPWHISGTLRQEGPFESLIILSATLRDAAQ